jgi:hypothetical protein
MCVDRFVISLGIGYGLRFRIRLLLRLLFLLFGFLDWLGAIDYNGGS